MKARISTTRRRALPAFLPAFLPALGISALGLPAQAVSARLIHFTTDGTSTGKPLLPGFRMHSVWSGLGVSSRGQVYVAVSNHLQPGGNVAVFKFDPFTDKVKLLGDLKSISTAAKNWMTNESQHKVHTFLREHADGKIYLATDDYLPTPFLRGAHIYTIDPVTDRVSDFSQTQPFLMDKSLKVIANPGRAAVRSGVFIEYYGIKGLSLNPRAPGVFYAMTYPDGHLIEFTLSNGAMRTVGRSVPVSYVMYTDNAGNIYYAKKSGTGFAIVKYVRATGKTTTVRAAMPGAELGAIAPTSCGRYVYCLVPDTKKVYRLDCVRDRFEDFATLCGSNWWRVYNLSLGPSGRELYYVSNNNSRSTVRAIDLATKTCREVLDVNALLGTRDLCFGGVNVWDDAGNLYAPVWTYPNKADVALLQVRIGDRALAATPATLSASLGGTQNLILHAGPDHGGEVYAVAGSLGGPRPGFSLDGIRIPLGYPDPYFDFTFQHPNSALLPKSLGRLDASGSATASFHLPPGLNSLIGLRLHHAFVVLDGTATVRFASNAAALTLVR